MIGGRGEAVLPILSFRLNRMTQKFQLRGAKIVMKEVSHGNWRSEKGRPKEKTDIRCDKPKNMHAVLYRRQCHNPSLLKVLLQSDYAAKMCLCCETCEAPPRARQFRFQFFSVRSEMLNVYIFPCFQRKRINLT